MDLQFHNGYTATFGTDAVPRVAAGKTVESKPLSTAVATKAVLSAFNLSGIVTEASTGRPIPGATVRITFGPDTGRSTTTNSAGRYAFTGVVQGPLSFTVNASGHVTQTKTLDIQVDTKLDVALVRS